jgi:hypothetical protein
MWMMDELAGMRFLCAKKEMCKYDIHSLIEACFVQ